MSEFEIKVEFDEPYKYPENSIDVSHYREYTYTVYGEKGLEPGNGGNGGAGGEGGNPGFIMIEKLDPRGLLYDGIEKYASKGRYYKENTETDNSPNRNIEFTSLYIASYLIHFIIE